MDLKWEKPIKDGGAPITGYIIEKREVGSPKWTKACEVRKQSLSTLELHSKEAKWTVHQFKVAISGVLA